MHLSVVIPAYNEEKTLADTINKFNNYLKLQEFNYEMIIVNDGSKDKTCSISEELLLKYNKLRLINNQSNRGKGYVVRQGLLAAKGKFRLFIDADNATSIDHLEKAWPLFEKGYDVIFGSRNEKDAPDACQIVSQAWWKKMLGVLGNSIVRIFLVKNIYDTQCGFKVLTKNTVEKIIPKMKINRWAFDAELLALAQSLNLKIGAIPVKWVNNPVSRVGIKGYFLTLLEVIKIKINFITGKYKLK